MVSGLFKPRMRMRMVAYCIVAKQQLTQKYDQSTQYFHSIEFWRKIDRFLLRKAESI
jgi:hypothetical protein